MKTFNAICLVLLIFFQLPSFAVNSEVREKYDLKRKAYSKYKTKPGDTVANILRQLGLKPIWGKKGYLKKVTELNDKSPFFDSLHKIKTDVTIYLPLKNMHPDYEYDSKGFLILPETSSQTRGIASNGMENDLSKLSFQFPCQNYSDPNIYKNLEKFIEKKPGDVREIDVKFLCNEEKNRPYSIFPWMLSNEDEVEKKQIGIDYKDKENYFLPYLGSGQITYSEGDSFTTNFEHLYLSLEYRKLIRSTKWYFDAKLSYTVLNLSSDLNTDEPKLLNMDFRIGRGLMNLKEPWHLTLFGGVYYSQMFVKDDLYGYKGTYYPQIYPEFRRTLESGNAITFFFKYIPTSDSFLSFKEGRRALSLGASYYNRGKDFPLIFKIEYSDFQFNSEKTNTDVKIKELNLSIGTGF